MWGPIYRLMSRPHMAPPFNVICKNYRKICQEQKTTTTKQIQYASKVCGLSLTLITEECPATHISRSAPWVKVLRLHIWIEYDENFADYSAALVSYSWGKKSLKLSWQLKCRFLLRTHLLPCLTLYDKVRNHLYFSTVIARIFADKAISIASCIPPLVTITRKS